MTRKERQGALKERGLTMEAVAAKHGWNYSVAAQVMRVGAGVIGDAGSRTREIAEGIAAELGRPYAEVWGENGGEKAA